MKKLLIGLAAFGIILAGCQKKEPPAPKPAAQETQPAAQTAPTPRTDVVVEKVYEGILPCADCSGIKTRVKISGKEGDASTKMFEQTMTYMGKEPNNVFVEKGNYTIQRGMGNDSNAVVYIFNPEKAKDDQYYYAVYSNDPNTLYSLDRDMKKIESNLNYALKLTN